MRNTLPFDSLYAHGFVRVAVATPRVAIANPEINAVRTVELALRADRCGALLTLFPELGLSGYSIDDLVQQDALLDEVERAIVDVLAATRELHAIMVIGAPLRSESKLFNCALVIQRGLLLGVVPKAYLPNYREFYEGRHYAAADEALHDRITVAGQRIPFGTDLLFTSAALPDFTLHVEICEDLWVPIPPSSYAALAGATMLANLSASNATIGKAEYRRLLCKSQSARCVAAYAYAASGYGESTTDLAWDGHGLICENGTVLAESARFPTDGQCITADVDLDRLHQERMRLTSFNDCVRAHKGRVEMRRIEVSLQAPTDIIQLRREIPRYPFVPSDAALLDERCEEAYAIQVQGLARRLEAVANKVVIGLSGGLDSTQALLVAAKTMDKLGLPRSNILAYSLPGFATTEHSRAAARKLMRYLRVSAGEIDIRASAMQMLRDIGHPYARGETVYDITFENVQAGERASHLFRLANLHGALVVGTSDLSELALGYTTYGVGDQMSHYAVNASVPKTLIRHLVGWIARSGEVDREVSETLENILRSQIAPELIPEFEGKTVFAEDTVGPYELQDFNLYYLSRFGFRPSKVAYLAYHAWSQRGQGTWPSSIPETERREYDLTTIKRWLGAFIQRFFQSSQFKRSALPNGPKVGSGGSLSPRADWRAPSDATADAWLKELRSGVPERGT